MRTVVHLTASTFFGGPERQMLGLARALPPEYRTAFVLFREGGRCEGFLDEVVRAGFEGAALRHDAPRFRKTIAELAGRLRGADVLCCHGYKADLLGRLAARRAGIPAVAVSRGWTGESLRMRCYEALDRFCLGWMDRVVCVSEGQAAKVRRAAVPEQKIAVIRNAVRPERFAAPRTQYRELLRGFFTDPPEQVVGAAGRLSPEKGFSVFIEAAAAVARQKPGVGFVLFGEGRRRAALEAQVIGSRLEGRFVLAGFRGDLDELVPHLDLMVLPSFTEGLPNVLLEASAAGVPVVATAVGGTPEVVEDGVTGLLAPPGDPATLAARIIQVLDGDPKAMGARGRERVRREFTFEAQAELYGRLFDELAARPAAAPLAA
jgi:glycosyltransferase involved in cell wall biosynthesis